MEGIPNHTADEVDPTSPWDSGNVRHLVTSSVSFCCDGIICDQRAIEILVQPTDH